LDLARRLADPDTYWLVAGSWLFHRQAPQHNEERLRLVEELAGQSRAGVSMLILSMGFSNMVHAFLEFGMRRRAEDILAEMRAAAERSGQANMVIGSMM
jgi:hypothetical protein